MITPSSSPAIKESRELYRSHLDRLAGMDELVAGAGGIHNVLLAIGSNTDAGHYAVFILDLNGNNIETVYRESKTA